MLATLAIIFVFLFGFFAIAGLGCLVTLLCWWGKWGPVYQEWIPKVTIASFRFSAALAALVPRSIPGSENDPHWLWASIAAGIAWLLWEIVGVAGDFRSKATVKKIAELEKQAYIRTKLLTVFRRLVTQKAERIRTKVAEASGASRSISRAAKALAPGLHIGVALQELAFFLNPTSEKEEAITQSFRVGLYVAKEGIMQPFYAHDTGLGTGEPFASYKVHPARFSLENTANPAFAVKCIQTGELIIVEDCERQAKAGEFEYFEQKQKTYLKSMVAYPINNFRGTDGSKLPAALVIDTHVPGFFKEADRGNIQFFMEEFAARLKLEVLVMSLVEEG